MSTKCLSLAFPLESVKAPYFSVGVYECSVMGFSKYGKRDLLEIYFDLLKTTYPDTYYILVIQIWKTFLYQIFYWTVILVTYSTALVCNSNNKNKNNAL